MKAQRKINCKYNLFKVLKKILMMKRYKIFQDRLQIVVLKKMSFKFSNKISNREKPDKKEVLAKKA